MKIKTKLIAGTLLLIFFSVGVVSLVANHIAQGSTKAAMSEISRAKLSSALESKKSHIEQYLTNLLNQVRLMSLEYNTDSANYHFGVSFSEFTRSSGVTPAMKKEMIDYYLTHFATPYSEKSTSKAPSADEYFKDFTDNHWVMQYNYITANPYPVGEKHKMDAPSKEFSSYSSGHRSYHEVFRSYADALGYGDIYFIDEKGLVTYSLNKGFELGTSVVDGPFAESGLGRAFQGALKAKKGELVVEDFSRYAPQMDAPAAFIAAPLVKFKRVRGVFVVQLPIDVIDSVMTNNKEWKKVGLGDTGETYLVGPDYTLRNASRLQSEDPEAYLKRLNELNNINSQPIKEIITAGTSIGLQRVVTESTQAALAGESGFQIISQPAGGRVLSTYAPIDVEGLNWAIISEIDYDEAFKSSVQLSSELNTSLAIIASVIMLIAIAVVLFLAKIIFKPLNMITKKMHEIANGNGNLKHRLDDSGNDEIAYFANGFNSFISKLDYIVDRVTETSSLLQRQSEELINLSRQGKGKSLDQKNTMSNVVDSIHEITANVDKNTEYANSTSEVTAIANERANDGKKATNAAVSAIEAVANDVNAASEALKELEGGSKEIAEVLSVIDDISNQTNLLALNAAIEAARAGENGRGFAVVADEVRSLSYRIQTETHSIAETIGKLQKGTADAVHTMEQSVGYSESGVELATEAGVTLDAVVESSSQITKMNSKIADATKQQSVIIHNINANIEAANGLAEDTTQSVIAIDGIGNQISSLANEMQGLVSQFNQDGR